MTLVERLRGSLITQPGHETIQQALIRDAAARIDVLEEALRDVNRLAKVGLEFQSDMGRDGSDFIRVLVRAHAALGLAYPNTATDVETKCDHHYKCRISPDFARTCVERLT